MTTTPGGIRPPLPGSEEETPDGLLLRVIGPGTILWRMHRWDQGALFFGGSSVDYRFNDPGLNSTHADAPAPYQGSRRDRGTYGVCYFGFQREAAFVETFLRRPSKGEREISESEIKLRRISQVVTPRDLRLIQLDGPGLSRSGTEASVVSGTNYTLSRTVSRLLWRRAEKPDGILYATRHDNHLYAAALFNRAEKGLLAGPPQEVDDAFLASLIRRYKFKLI